MAIKNIKVSNFKSFKELDLELGNFNVMIGANAAGKSNFTQIFKFLKDIERESLNDVIAMNGGLESIRNLSIGAKSNFTMFVGSDNEIEWGLEDSVLTMNEITYEFDISFDENGQDFKLQKDELTEKLEITPKNKDKNLFNDDSEGLQGVFTISHAGEKLSFLTDPSELHEQLTEKGIMPNLSFLHKFGIPPGTLLIQTPYAPIPPWGPFFGDIAIYDIDPHVAKRPVPIAGKAELDEDGGNLALILNKIIKDTDNKRKFRNLIKDLLPFVDDIGVEKFAEKSLSVKLHESYYKDDLSAHLLSDGTVNITALIVALYFEEKDITIIEEPERNIHPHLISRLVDMMKDASENKQIIITTHSPEIVKHAGLENLLLVSRNKDGFSTISRPEEKKDVKIFLENELGLDELYIQNLLGD